MIVEIPSNVKHWHGATRGSWFSNITFSIPEKGTSTQWCEEITDDEYNKLS